MLPTLPDNAPVEEVAGVHLHAGFGGADLDLSSAERVIEGRSRLKTGTFSEHKIVVVSTREPQLLVVFVDVSPDGAWLAEVERGTLDGQEAAGRN